MSIMNLNDVIENEKCVLGSVFRDNNALDKIQAEFGIEAAMFYDQRNQTVFTNMVKMRESRIVIDERSILDFLSDRGDLNRAGGIAYVDELTDKVPTGANYAYYCKRFIPSWKQRETDKILAGSREKIKAGNDPAAVIKEQSEQMKHVLSVGGSAFKTLRQMKEPFRKRLLSDIERKERTGFVGIDCGMYHLDDETGGFQKGELVILAANSGGGKTTLAETWLLHMLKNGHKVAFVSLDMGTEALTRRLLSIVTRVPLMKFKKADMSKDEANNLIDKTECFNGESSDNLFIVGRELADLEKLKPQLLNLVRAKGVEIIFIDYAQLVTKEQDGRTKDYNVDREISNGLKGLALELDVPIVALSQTNSNAYSEKAKKEPPSLNQIGGGMAFIQPADFVFILRKDEENKDKKLSTLIVLKAREEIYNKKDGKDFFEVTLRLDPATRTFEDIGDKPQQ